MSKQKRFWASFKSMIKRVWNFILRSLGKMARPVSLLCILALAWYGFLMLVKTPPLETTPVLIMIWVTAAILIIALFPAILNNLKKVKVGDFEIELQESIKIATTESFLSVSDLPLKDFEYFRANKNGVHELGQILGSMSLDPRRPILLTVNLGKGISKAFLFVYLYLMQRLGNLVVVLFTYQPTRMGERDEFALEDIIGVISGNRLRREYYRRFPSLYELRTRMGQRPDEDISGIPVFFPAEDILDLIEESYRLMERQRDFGEPWNVFANREYSDSLSYSEVKSWLFDSLNKEFIDSSLTKYDIGAIIRSLTSGDEFVILTEGSIFKTILILDKFARDISNKVLINMAAQK